MHQLADLQLIKLKYVKAFYFMLSRTSPKRMSQIAKPVASWRKQWQHSSSTSQKPQDTNDLPQLAFKEFLDYFEIGR